MGINGAGGKVEPDAEWLFGMKSVTTPSLTELRVGLFFIAITGISSRFSTRESIDKFSLLRFIRACAISVSHAQTHKDAPTRLQHDFLALKAIQAYSHEFTIDMLPDISLIPKLVNLPIAQACIL